ncbi:hypothetical protein, partial [Klebsiella pneumoniae]|uniref:hypothetical protein n=1 Tax=Klebsiella pneumoniae TaxID=573 RepID=UPI00385308BB
IAFATRLYRAQSITPTFRISPLTAPDADAALEKAGFTSFDPSLALTAPLTSFETPADERVGIVAKADWRWVTAAAVAYGGDKSDHTALNEIV